MPKFFFITGAVLLFLFTVWLFLAFASTKTYPVNFCISFNQNHAASLGLNWKDTYLALLEDLHPQYIRIAAMWSEVEKEDGKHKRMARKSFWWWGKKRRDGRSSMCLLGFMTKIQKERRMCFVIYRQRFSAMPIILRLNFGKWKMSLLFGLRSATALAMTTPYLEKKWSWSDRLIPFTKLS